MKQNPYNEVVMSAGRCGASFLHHHFIWGASREGMSQMGMVADVAVLNTGAVILVTQGAIERNDMPPGFVRLLSEEEKNKRGVRQFIDHGEGHANLLRSMRASRPGAAKTERGT